MSIPKHVREHIVLQHKLCSLKLPDSPASVNWPNPGTVDWFETVLDEANMHPSYAVTFQDTGDTVTRANHGWINTTEVSFPTIVSTTGISINTKYFIINSTANTFQVSATSGGAALPLTTNGTGTITVWPSRIVMPANGWAKFNTLAWFGRGAGWTVPQVIVNGMVLGTSILKNGTAVFYGHVEINTQLMEMTNQPDQPIQTESGWLAVSAGDYFTAVFNNNSGFGTTFIDLSPSGRCFFQCEFTSSHP